jgi:MFS family permease
MQNAAPMINQAHRGGMLRLAFLSAVVSVVVSFGAAAAPIPLYNIYRAEDGFTNADISMAVVAYAVGTIGALLVLGRLSNHLGRRLTAIASLGLLLLGCLLLLENSATAPARSWRISSGASGSADLASSFVKTTMPPILLTLKVIVSKLMAETNIGDPAPLQPTLVPAVVRGARVLNGIFRKPLIRPITVNGRRKSTNALASVSIGASGPAHVASAVLAGAMAVLRIVSKCKERGYRCSNSCRASFGLPPASALHATN